MNQYPEVDLPYEHRPLLFRVQHARPKGDRKGRKGKGKGKGKLGKAKSAGKGKHVKGAQYAAGHYDSSQVWGFLD